MKPLLLRFILRTSGLRSAVFFLSGIFLFLTASVTAKADTFYASHEGMETDFAVTRSIDTIPDDILTAVEIEASFPGGHDAWIRYISDELAKNIGKFRRKDYGTCIIRFVVDEKGKVTDVEAMTMEKSRLAKVAINAIKNGPDWTPAQQEDRFVKAYRIQPIVLKEPDKPSR